MGYRGEKANENAWLLREKVTMKQITNFVLEQKKTVQ
jgi:hypothetical protein